MALKRIVCFANSKKDYPNRCVAGVEITDNNFNGWLRPVGNRPSHSILLDEQAYADGTSVMPMDIVEIDFGLPAPAGYQSENVLISPGQKWNKVGTASLADVTPCLHSGAGPIWPGEQSSAKGINDELTEDTLAGVASSLSLVRPDQATVIVSENQFNNHLEARVLFQWGGSPIISN